MGLNSLLGIGSSALGSSQTAINVTGNNIANANTIGYSRQSARFQEVRNPEFTAGQLGQGVKISEVYRNFNRYIEDSYLERSSTYNRWEEQQSILQSVQSIFNESNTSGVSYALGEFFRGWQDLSLRPEDVSTREALLSNAETLANLIRNAKQGLDRVQGEMDMYINQSVGEINGLLGSIQKLNLEIGARDIPGISNANALKDQRDQEIRRLAELIDITVEDNGGSDFTIRTKSGHPLMEGTNIYSLQTSVPRTENDLRPASKYDGTVVIDGQDSHEYHFEVVHPPRAASTNPPVDAANGQMRVSLDGGKTFLRNDDGSEMLVDIPTDADHRIKVKDLYVSFNADPTKMVAGDKFSVVPKSGLYWVSPTRPPLNVTPQTLASGEDNPGRITGGKLAAYYNVRDQNVGRYMDKLDALSNTLIWEVNRIHSQGGGIKSSGHVMGSYSAANTSLPLADSATGITYGNRLTQGNFSLQIYDANGKPVEGLPRAIDFDPTTDGTQNFDPEKHSMEDVANAINRTYPNHVNANIVDGRLQITATNPGETFVAHNDSSGVLAALGINTFFQGDSAASIGINETIRQNVSLISAGKVNDDGTVAAGDNFIAKGMCDLASRSVKISTTWESVDMTLGAYYGTTVGVVGSETKSAMVNADYNGTLADDLDERCSAVSGVNLDEEMTNLIKFQHSYTAAAKLITTADQMIQTLLGLKQ